ncbi:aminotransferase class I/II-fold pyridoxal phosphate-dependent enzyme [Halovulum dunhuangense]|uniref:aspartate transaminase n=1 Tax=Halovulum dunhuangense TaxID=1505036 RepID=A0A849L399_9RHOB|nr:aminotransferase class I/II-fold pyridoxal phosphate-dependent enzyme [Halovulum dunhuangense]NNU80661.1 aminotransferase class I/II-fold pyridoxal phosphate-dependent enzyme [Halovulum dunhuangense]
MRTSSRGDVDAFIVMDVLGAARAMEAAGRHIIHMEVGQPATGAPQAAREALARAMEQGTLGYTEALGLPALRARIARLYGEWYGVDLAPSRVVVTAGSSAGFQLAFLSLFETGDRVAIGDPGYPSYRNILKALGLTPVRIPTGAESRWQLTPDHLTGDVQGALVASPANPTGTMLDHAALSALMEAARARDIGFVSDEIYHGIDYGTRPVTALEAGDDVYVINSFSKYFCMTGWRIGWMVVPEDHVRRIERLAQNLFICAPHASQVAALAALDCGAEMETNLETYRANRAHLLAELPKAGFARIAPPDGAFYLYADVSDLTEDSRALAAEILEDAGVAVTPGLDFDPERGHRSLRFSYAGSTADMIEGAERLKAWFQRRGAA